MITILLGLFAPAAFAGGGVYISIEEVTTLVTCNNGKVKFQEELWSYGDEGTELKWTLVVSHKGQKEVFRATKKEKLMSAQGSKVSFLADYDQNNGDGSVTSSAAYLDTDIKFDGSAGTVSAWEYKEGKKGAKFLDQLEVKDCYLE